MSTASSGGQPTVTSHTVPFTSNYVTDLYVCPSNFIAYVSLTGYQVTSGSGSFTASFSANIADGMLTAVSLYSINNLFGITVPSTVLFDTDSNTTFANVYTRLINPILNPLISDKLGGQIILYPGESISVSITGGGHSGIISFATLEVTASN